LEVFAGVATDAVVDFEGVLSGVPAWLMESLTLVMLDERSRVIFGDGLALLMSRLICRFGSSEKVLLGWLRE